MKTEFLKYVTNLSISTLCTPFFNASVITGKYFHKKISKISFSKLEPTIRKSHRWNDRTLPFSPIKQGCVRFNDKWANKTPVGTWSEFKIVREGCRTSEVSTAKWGRNRDWNVIFLNGIFFFQHERKFNFEDIRVEFEFVFNSFSWALDTGFLYHWYFLIKQSRTSNENHKDFQSCATKIFNYFNLKQTR